MKALSALVIPALLCSCSLFIERLGENCQQEAPFCAGDVSVQCINGAELRVQCDNLCEPDLGLCASCGDGHLSVSLNEECEDGNDSDADSCKADCTLNFCGDGFLDPNSEECDDGGTCGDVTLPCLSDDDCENGDCIFVASPGGGCDELCQQEICGNGIFQPGLGFGVPGEECDDGNTEDGDGCSSTCQTEFCGDGAINLNSFGACIDLNGNGFCDPNEFPLDECDDGNGDSNDDCTGNCRIAVCGDGIQRDLNFNGPIEPGDEECDDGKHCDDGALCFSDSDCTTGACQIRSGDGCSDNCLVEFCGDGAVQPATASVTFQMLLEQCDPNQDITFRVNGQVALFLEADPTAPPINFLCDCISLVGIASFTTKDPSVLSLFSTTSDNVVSVQFPGRLAWAFVSINGIQSTQAVIFDADGGDDAPNNPLICIAGFTEDDQEKSVTIPPLIVIEQCDDGNNIDGDGCDGLCQNE
jgi:cysteine-rich repeat protein